MNLQQLRILRETIRQEFNLTKVAETLYTAQPGVSKHIKDLEEELGIEIFLRRGKRLTGLTEPGKELLVVVERILLDLQNVRSIADQFVSRDTGNLIIATTHTQARYVLPEVIRRFKQQYPKVHLVLQQGNPDEIADRLSHGLADVAIATEGLLGVPNLITFPCYQWQHALVVLPDHPLAQCEHITLAELATYPIITYDKRFTGRSKIDHAFAQAALQPDIVLSAIDADVIKTYVSIGLGVGIIADMAYDPARDGHLVKRSVPGLFAMNTSYLALCQGAHLRSYAHAFIEQLLPGVSV
ncbi:MAG: CysB family HTH-type transcriptional regulator [Pseudomonadota bacterium]